MKLEDLVPPLELCKLIPKGEFEDSALMWVEDVPPTLTPFVEPRRYVLLEDEEIPAPTLEEIMERLHQDYIKAGAFIRSYWGCYIINNYGDEIAEVDDNSPATAALKLWLKPKGIDVQEPEK